VNYSGPSAEWAAGKPQHVLDLCVKFSDNDVNRNHIGIPAVNAWGVDQIIPTSLSLPVPTSDDLVGDEPPKVFQKVWTRQVRDFVPNEASLSIINLNVFYSLAVEVHFVTEVPDQMLYLFGDAALCPMSLIYERRNDSDPHPVFHLNPLKAQSAVEGGEIIAFLLEGSHSTQQPQRKPEEGITNEFLEDHHAPP
jgi:hypothetical protein